MKAIIVGIGLAILMSPFMAAGIVWYYVRLHFCAGVEVGELLFESLNNWLDREIEKAEHENPG